jgi:hypothetical protein
MDRRILGLGLFAVAALLACGYYLCDAVYHSGAIGKGVSNDYWHHWSFGGLPMLIPIHAALWTGLVYFIIGEVVHLVRLFTRREPPPPPVEEERPAERGDTRFRS